MLGYEPPTGAVMGCWQPNVGFPPYALLYCPYRASITPKGCYNTAQGLAPVWGRCPQPMPFQGRWMGGMGCFDTPNNQKMRIYAKKVNKLLAVSKDYRIFANENCVFTQEK